MMIKKKKIAIIGVGLIGGSIALGLKYRLGNEIIIFGSCKSLEHALQAKNKGIIDEVISKISDLPEDLFLLVLATPLSSTLRILPKLLKNYNISQTAIIDVASTKQEIVNSANKISTNINFIGSHPLAGSEENGFENSDPNLFINKTWVLCPLKNTKTSQLNKIRKIIRLLGARPMICDPQNHDFLTSYSSHLYLAISSILIHVSSHSQHWPAIAEFASTGFRDTTRLASFNPLIKQEIIISNQLNIINTLTEVKKEIDLFIKTLKSGQKNLLNEYFKHSKLIRDNWLRNFN